MIFLENVIKKYKNGNVALKGITLRLPSVGLVALCGENGCGKTTLLNMISSIDIPTSGNISYDNIPYIRKNYRYIRNKVVSYIEQETSFINYLTIIENINLLENNNNEVKLQLEKFNIANKCHEKPYNLSGGQKQRALLIRGICKDTKVLIVDEPTSKMDRDAEKLTFEVLKKISRNKLVIIVSHNDILVEKYADLIIKMEQGEITRIIEQYLKHDIILNQNCFYIPNEDNIDVSDWIEIRRILSLEKEVVLKLYEPTNHSSKKLDYSYNLEEKVYNKYNWKNVIKLSLKSFNNSIFKTILSSFFITLFVVVLGIVIGLNDVNIARFEYDTFLNNGYDVINIENDDSIYVNTNHSIKEFEKSDYYNLNDKYNVSTTLLSDFVNFRLKQYDDVFNGVIYGFSLVNSFDNYKFICGHEPLIDEVVITDFMADTITEVYKNSYEDILENGITYNDYNIKVSGIVDTNYEDKIKTADTTFKYSNEYLDWLSYAKTIAARLYIKPSEINSTIHMLPLNDGMIFCDVKITNDDNIKKNSAIVNTKLASLINAENISKKGYVYITGTEHDLIYEVSSTIDDDNANPTFYVSQDEFDKIKSRLYKLDSFNMSLNNLEAYEFLKDFKLKHNTPISNNINDVSEIILGVKAFLIPFIIVLTLITFIVAVFFWVESVNKDKFTIYCLLMNGVNFFQIHLYSHVKIILKLSIEIVLSILQYIILLKLINLVVSNLCDANVLVFNNNFSALFSSCALYMPILIIFNLVYISFMITKRPIKLFVTTSK